MLCAGAGPQDAAEVARGGLAWAHGAPVVVHRGLATLVNALAGGAAPLDVVVVSGWCEPGEGWLERLGEAAQGDAGIAAACAVADVGDGYTLAALAHALPVDAGAARLAAGLELSGDPRGTDTGRVGGIFGSDQATASEAHGGDAGFDGGEWPQPLWPAQAQAQAPSPTAGPGAGLAAERGRAAVAVADGPVVWLRASGLSLLGGLDASLKHPWALLADLSARARARGLRCVLTGDVVVNRRGGAAPGCPDAELEEIARRHPWLAAERAYEALLEAGPLRRAMVAARAAPRISVTLDARSLGPAVGGTQTYVSALVLALAARPELRVRAVVAPDAPAAVRAAFAAAGTVEVCEYEDAAAGALPRSDVVHRPQQLFTAADDRLVRLLGERIVITQQDLIAYHNPLYHGSYEHWQRHRRVTRVSLAAADAAVFFTAHARDDALAQDLIESDRTVVAGIGVQAEPGGETAEGARAPAGVPPDRRVLLVLGADYLHKNRPFAIELAAALRERHGWDGVLVLAGTHVQHGSSAPAERELLATMPSMAHDVIDTGRVGEAEKRWLLAHADALLCPSTQEGYGLTPLEAAAAGTPCVYAATTALEEVLGAAGATIVPWDARASADRAAPLLTPGAARDEHLRLMREALGHATWEPVVESLLDAYRHALGAPFRSATPRVWQDLALEQRLAQLDASHDRFATAYYDLEARADDGLPLIDRRGGLLTAAQQRGLMRVASRRWLRAPLLGPLGLLGRAEPDRPPG